MKKILFPFLVILLCSFTKADAPGGISQSDRDFVVNLMKDTKAYLYNAVKGLTPSQYAYKAAPDKWSIAECLEHIATAEAEISKGAQDLMAAPADTSKRSEIKVTAQQISVFALDRSQKHKAPEFLKPTNRFATPELALASYTANRDKAIAYLSTTQDALHDHMRPHPAFGMLDAYQWYVLIAAHSKRHTLQIEEVKADAGFPK